MGVIELLTVAETAALLKTTKQQVRKMIAQQLIPALKIGREWRISRQYLEDFLRNNLILYFSANDTPCPPPLLPCFVVCLSNTLYRKTGNFAASVFIPICAGAAPAW